ncbi:MAG: tRNA (guanosine(37)-N1)-methyltransferase TrmD [Aestuariivita sp.]|nr:tRNA (guanosine(37)-N1)-methyltransferase TrmD [Aestuariivita sp.]
MTHSASRSKGFKTINPNTTPRALVSQSSELSTAWKAAVISLFPEAFPGLLDLSLSGRARNDGLWQLKVHNLRNYGLGKHRKVDDTPAGGGAGMIIRPDVMGHAIEAVIAETSHQWSRIYLSPRGHPINQPFIEELARADGVILICGRYEGLDERTITHYGLEERSLGDFVLSGGELAAQALIDATVRLLPGVIGNYESTKNESFSNDLLEHPHYTRPTEWKGYRIPPILTSGNHQEVTKWRIKKSKIITRARRPDLWTKYVKSRR